MQIINLRKQYPSLYTEDVFVEVSDEVAEAILLAIRQDNNYRRRTCYHKAYYSLDRGDGIEHDALHFTPSPEEIFSPAGIVGTASGGYRPSAAHTDATRLRVLHPWNEEGGHRPRRRGV